MKMIPMVEASDMPIEVEDFCVAMEWGIHYQGDVVVIQDDRNPFSEWLKQQGFAFTEKYQYVAINPT